MSRRGVAWLFRAGSVWRPEELGATTMEQGGRCGCTACPAKAARNSAFVGGCGEAPIPAASCCSVLTSTASTAPHAPEDDGILLMRGAMPGTGGEATPRADHGPPGEMTMALGVKGGGTRPCGVDWPAAWPGLWATACAKVCKRPGGKQPGGSKAGGHIVCLVDCVGVGAKLWAAIAPRLAPARPASHRGYSRAGTHGGGRRATYYYGQPA